MELKVSAEKPGFSSSDCASDPEDKEISEGEDEDDDRNHKHRRREARSQSMEGDSLDQGLTRPYRKRNRPFENGYSHREGDSQSGVTWKNYNYASDREFPSRFEKRRPNQASFSRAPLELNQRMRGNQMMSVEVGPVRGRGREPLSWGIRDPRLGLVDVAVQAGPVPPALFAGRGLPNVSNAQNTSWNAFGLVPGVPNGGLDSLHPLGLQGALRPAINPPMNIGIPRQRCRDFEERGFCLRGDMCPMEHGVNRIVIEDVQSLSQFNLPVSLPGSQLLGTSSGQGALPVISTSSVSLANNKSFHTKSSKPGSTEEGFDLNGGGVGGSMAGASDVYDPDQPLWTNDDPETSAALQALNQSHAGEPVSFPEMESYEGFNDERPLRNDERPLRNATTAGPHNSSVWGRISNSKRSSGVKEKTDSVGTSSNYLARDIKSEEALPNVSHQGKRTNVDGNGQLVNESSVKPHNDSVRNNWKPSQKALRTLFVNGIPLKDNKREALLSHFQKFGEVIDIHIPMHSERAFVQFSKREEAEAALKAPDAVMGNRFIKLWWANRDNIPDDGISGATIVPITPRGMTLNPALSHPFILDRGKENPQPAGGKDGNSNASAAQLPFHDHPKPVVGNVPKAPPQQQKKLENLELLKEELRKKQEMLDQKRNEFRRQLDKLQKQAVGTKDVTVDSTTKQHKGETPSDQTSKSSPRDNKMTEDTTYTEPHTSTTHPTVPVPEPLKPSFRPLAPLGQPFAVNRFKLDNRPTIFRIASPLPAGLANVDALKEHFSTFGELSSVELEQSECQETDDASLQSNVSARVSFTTRRFAERAFVHGKIWQGQKLQFKWLISTNSGKESGGPGNVSVSTVTTSDANIQPSSSSGNVSASNNVQSDANIKPSGENASSPSQETVALENGEPECLGLEDDVESAEGDKDSKTTSA